MEALIRSPVPAAGKLLAEEIIMLRLSIEPTNENLKYLGTRPGDFTAWLHIEGYTQVVISDKLRILPSGFIGFSRYENGHFTGEYREPVKSLNALEIEWNR